MNARALAQNKTHTPQKTKKLFRHTQNFFLTGPLTDPNPHLSALLLLLAAASRCLVALADPLPPAASPGAPSNCSAAPLLRNAWINELRYADAAEHGHRFVEVAAFAGAGLDSASLALAALAPDGSLLGSMRLADCFLHDIRGTRPGGDPTGWGSCVGLNASARADVVAWNVSVVGNVFNSSDVAYQNCITAQTHGGCVWPGAQAGGFVNTDGVLFASNLVKHVLLTMPLLLSTSTR